MWAPAICAMLGIWLIIAPTLLGYGEPATTNDRIVGPTAASLAIIAMWEVTRPVRWANLPLGIWLMVAPWLLGYTSTPTINSIAVGLALVILAIIRGKVRQRFGGGWSSLWGTNHG